MLVAADRVDPHPPARAAVTRGELLDDVARGGLAPGGDAVLEVEDQRVGLAGDALAIFFSLSAGTNSQLRGGTVMVMRAFVRSALNGCSDRRVLGAG